MPNCSIVQHRDPVLELRMIPNGRHGDPYDMSMNAIIHSKDRYIEITMLTSSAVDKNDMTRLKRQMIDMFKLFVWLKRTYKMPILAQRKKGKLPYFRLLTRDWWEFIGE